MTPDELDRLIAAAEKTVVFPEYGELLAREPLVQEIIRIFLEKPAKPTMADEADYDQAMFEAVRDLVEWKP